MAPTPDESRRLESTAAAITVCEITAPTTMASTQAVARAAPSIKVTTTRHTKPWTRCLLEQLHLRPEYRDRVQLVTQSCTFEVYTKAEKDAERAQGQV